MHSLVSLDRRAESLLLESDNNQSLSLQVGVKFPFQLVHMNYCLHAIIMQRLLLQAMVLVVLLHSSFACSIERLL
jgi:hypothetical protein